MNTGLPYHRGVILQKGRGVGSVLVRNNQELFKIHHILTNLPTPMYQIISLKNPGDGIIKGNFYGYELVKSLNQ